jgi:hypothetical protein
VPRTVMLLLAALTLASPAGGKAQCARHMQPSSVRHANCISQLGWSTGLVD